MKGRGRSALNMDTNRFIDRCDDDQSNLMNRSSWSSINGFCGDRDHTLSTKQRKPTRTRPRDTPHLRATCQPSEFEVAMTMRICWAHSAEVKSGPTGSTKIRSLIVLSVLK